MKSIACWLGALAASVQLNKLIFPEYLRNAVVKKKRLWFSQYLIWAGNVYAVLMNLTVRVLHRKPWERREIAAHKELYGEDIYVSEHWVIMPWHGQTLSLVLMDDAVDVKKKMNAMNSAAKELKRIHGITLSTEPGRSFTHADAGVRNVAIKDGRAHWFDFEMVHAASKDLNSCRADDLRAFLFSALACMPESHWDEVFTNALDGYQAATVFQALLDLINSGQLDTDTYHLAQISVNKVVHARMQSQVAFHLKIKINALASAAIDHELD